MKILTCTAVAASLGTAALSPAQTPDSVFRALDRAAASDLQSLHIPGIVVAVVENGRITYARGYGVANIETGAPVTPDMLFRVGSISKPVTALTVLVEARARGIPLDAPIGRYMKGLSPRLGRLTLAGLLEHTAGVADTITATPIAEDDNESDLVPGVRRWTDAALFTEAGDVHSYSNPGYILAGAFIEAVTGKPYSQLAAERVLDPVGMTHATFSANLAVTYPFSQGHDGTAGAAPHLVRPIKTDARHLPSTFLWASANDVARLAIALMNRGTIDGHPALDSAVIDTILKPRMHTPDGLHTFGTLGFLVTEGAVPVFGKTGRLDGYGARLVMAPTLNRAYVFMQNRLDATPVATERALNALLVPGGRPAPQPDTSGTVPTIAELLGRYANGPRVLTITENAGTLELLDRDPTERTLRGTLQIAADGHLDFAFTNDQTGARGRIRFQVLRDRSGNVKYLYTGEHAFRKQ